MPDDASPPTPAGPVQRLVSLVRSQKWTADHRQGLAILEELVADHQELEGIREYLWPNQTGLPNKHRNCLIAIQAREQLLKRQRKTK